MDLITAFLEQNYGWVYIWTISFCLMIFALVFFTAEKKYANRIFLALMASFIVWLGVNFIAETVFETGAAEIALLFGRLTSLGGYIATFMLWFAYVYPDGKRLDLSLWKKALLFVPPTICVVFAPFTDLYIPWIADTFTQEFEPGPLYSAMMLYMMGVFLVWIPIITIRRIRRTSDAQTKGGLKTVLFGSVAFALSGILFSGILPEFEIFIGMFLTPLTVFLFIVPVLRSILRGGMFSTKAIAAELFAGVIVMITLMQLYSSRGTAQMGLNLIIFLMAVVFSVFLVRSVIREVQAREEVARLAASLEVANKELAGFNEHLEDKIKEQAQAIEQAYEVEKKAREEAEQLDASRNAFIITTEEHLREPVKTIRNVTGALRTRQAGQDLSGDREGVGRMKEAVDSLFSLVNKLLDMSQMEMGKAVIVAKPVALCALAKELIAERFDEASRKKGITLSLECPADVQGLEVSVDATKVKELLDILLRNALQYTERGSIRVTLKKILHPIEKKTYCRISVQDTGAGMTEEKAQAVLSASATQTGGRTGLRLAKEIALAHHGKIWAASEGEGKGSAFYVDLPLEIKA